MREDYSADGEAWDYFTHDQARMRTYRWSENGLGGICDTNQYLCLAPALWNGRDPYLKERAFALTGKQGNRGEGIQRGEGDYGFLRRVFHKLLLNFSWWINRKDADGHNLFEGGFLGLDNVSVYDRSKRLPAGYSLKQADATGWMAHFSLKMTLIALELCVRDSDYEDIAIHCYKQFLAIAEAIAGSDETGAPSLWDPEIGFFTDLLRAPAQAMPTKHLNRQGNEMIRIDGLVLAVHLVFLPTSGTAEQRDVSKDPPAFEPLMAESGMELKTPEGLAQVEVLPNHLFPYDRAFASPDGALEIRYAVRPLRRIIVDYEDPHNSALDPNHMFPLMFQSAVTLLSNGRHSPTREYPQEQAREKFNADWAAAAVFDVASRFDSNHKQALLVAIHKNALADAYSVFLFDDYEQARKRIDSYLTALTFLP